MRDAAASLGLANLFFFFVWYQVLDRRAHYFVKSPADALWTLLVNILLLAAVLLVVFRLGERRPSLRALGYWFSAVLLLSGLGVTRLPFYLAGKMDTTYALALWIPLLLALIGLLYAFKPRLCPLFPRLLLVLFPFAVLTFSQALFLLSKSAAFADAGAGPTRRPASARPARVVWIVFDELDDGVAFERRPPGLTLAGFDDLRQSAIYGSAWSPSDVTLCSIPSLLSGRMVESVRPTGPDSLQLRYRGEQSFIEWRESPGALLSQFGSHTAIIGTYHPYCRVLGDYADTCLWRDTTGWSRPAYSRQWITALALPALFARSDPRAWREHHVAATRELLAAGISVASDPKIQFAFLHFPFPHPPGIFDRAAGEMTAREGRSYLDNLALADAFLRRMKQAMQQTGVWDSTAVLMTSDHAWRVDFWRGQALWVPEDEEHRALASGKVPFLLRMRRQSAPLVLPGGFNTLATAGLVREILAGEIDNAESAVAWLREHASTEPTHTCEQQ